MLNQQDMYLRVTQQHTSVSVLLPAALSKKYSVLANDWNQEPVEFLFPAC